MQPLMTVRRWRPKSLRNFESTTLLVASWETFCCVTLVAIFCYGVSMVEFF